MEAACFQIIFVSMYQTTRRHIPEDRNLDTHRSENHRSHTLFLFYVFKLFLLYIHFTSFMFLFVLLVVITRRSIVFSTPDLYFRGPGL
jgi:hypothetical protein